MTELWNAVRSVVRSQREGVPMDRVSRDAPLRASFAQERIWFLEQLTPGIPLYSLTVALRLTGPLSVCCLERSLTEILRRHESLRTTLHLVDGQLIQRIHPPLHFELPLLDFRTMGEARQSLDLEKPPLMRGRLFTLGDEEHILEVTVHHLAFDGSSFDVFMRELCAIYRTLVEGNKILLNEASFQYADFAAWQRRRMDGAVSDELLSYWSRQMAGPLPMLRLPFDRPRGKDRQYRGALEDLALSKEQTEAMKRLCAKEKITPFMTLLAVFQALLYRYTGEEDVIVGSPVANRNRSEIQNMIGLFVNTVPLRTRVSGEMTFRQLLARVRDVVAGAYKHQELPFEMLLKAVDAPRQINGSPVFQVMFAYQNVPRSSWTIPGLMIDAWNIHNGTAKFDITFLLWEEASGVCGHLEYDTDLFDDATAAQWVRHFSALVAEVVADPDKAIGVIPLLSVAETQRVLREWNNTAVPYPREHTVHRLFEDSVRQFPHNTALVFDKVELTYRELDRRANQFARYLEKQGLRPGMLAGVCLRRSPEVIVTLIAILKTGAAYVPVDPSVPDDYLNRLLASANVSVVITTHLDAGRLSAESFQFVCLDTDRNAIDRESGEYRSASIPSEGLAYVMHTSGSTGAPKGVCITHRGIVRLVVGANYARLRAQDTFLQLAPLSFDLSTFEIWGSLLNGARLVIPSGERVSLAEIGDIICRHHISLLSLTTALFALLVDSHLAELRNVPQILVGGDVLSVSHLRRFLDQAKGGRLINCYGPTENTTFTSFHDVSVQDCVDGGSIPIGRPVSNTVIYVLDENLQPVPPGVSGEVWTGGDGLMRGYLQDPELTRQRMIANPFSDDPRSHLYKTGDLVRQRRDGTLEFLGRIDNQCKIRGFRVEPDEVAAAINTCPEVRSVEVIARDVANQGKRLIAYVVPTRAAGSSKDLISHLRHYARERLPEYLVPSEFVLLETLPLNRNGKVDRSALPVPQDSGEPQSVATQPRDDAEREVWMAFQRVLGIANIGIHDNFFELGGDSLMALRLFAILEDSLSTRLPLVTLFEHPTVAELALDVSRYSQRPRGALVEIKHGRTEMPLFFVPGGHGGMAEMTLYAKMMRHLREDQSVYGLLAQPHRSITENAAFYVNEIRRVQSVGPYTLGGECVGGVIAFEIAQQLLAQGHRIAVLLLMDTWCPVETGRFRAILRNRGWIARSGFFNLRRVLREDIRHQPPMKTSAWLRYWADAAGALAQKAEAWKSALNNIENTMRYHPEPYPGQITLLISSRNDEKGLPKPWRALARDGVVVHTVQGDHESYIRDTPGATAEQLRICLEEAMLRR